MTDSLESFRKRINNINEQLISLLDQRLDIAKEIGAIKKEQNLPIFNPEREQEILNSISKTSKYPEQTKEIFQKIMDESKKLQEQS
jgi:monofunctional chorismate mutase